MKQAEPTNYKPWTLQIMNHGISEHFTGCGRMLERVSVHTSSGPPSPLPSSGKVQQPERGENKVKSRAEGVLVIFEALSTYKKHI